MNHKPILILGLIVSIALLFSCQNIFFNKDFYERISGIRFPLKTKIIEWAREYCAINEKQFIRMDTWGDNQKLINYYVKCGFKFIGIVPLENTEGLPSHYKGSLALFEIKL